MWKVKPYRKIYVYDHTCTDGDQGRGEPVESMYDPWLHTERTRMKEYLGWGPPIEIMVSSDVEKLSELSCIDK